MNIQPTSPIAYKSELRPLPMRITQLQFERLKEARTRDGLSVQEHVRRSLDQYLAKIEREASRAPYPDAASSPPSHDGVMEKLPEARSTPHDPPPAVAARKPRPRLRAR